MQAQPARKQKRLRIFAMLVGGYILLCLPAIWSLSYFDTPIGRLVAVPMISIYLFDAVGIPGLMQNKGNCGWGWCSPSLFAWAFAAAFWLIVAWLIARITPRKP